MNDELSLVREDFIDYYLFDGWMVYDYIRHEIDLSFIVFEIEIPSERLEILY